MDASEAVGTVRALWRFPVKSMLGEELEAADLSEGGVAGDRAYALVDRDGQGRECQARKAVAELAEVPSRLRRTASARR